MKLSRLVIPLALLVTAAGCGNQRQPVIPRAAWTERTDQRTAVEGADTTRVRLTWPEFVGARRPEALDSLRAAVNGLLVASVPGFGQRAADPAALMDSFISWWNEERKVTRSRAFWRLERRVEVLADTLGVVSLAATDILDQGRERPVSAVQFVLVDADRGRTLGFADFFREELRDSLSAALEPLLREARGIAPDSSLKAAGFTFEDGRYHVGDRIAVTRSGMRFLVGADMTAHDALAAEDFVAPFELLRPFARPDGPLGRGRN